ncbi:MAG: PilZ domain-containing protein [Halobacteriovoraceae bacterium]|nr:PilZ domain-containing protein [Halobacteriovoraceae bacterium]
MSSEFLKKDPLKAIAEAVKNKEEGYSWYAFHSNIIKAELVVETIRKDRNEVVIRPLPGSIAYLQEMIAGQEYLNVCLPKSSLVFTSKIKWMNDEGKLLLSLPEKYSFSERRREERIEPNSSVLVNFKYLGNQVRKNCLDLGLGGFSIVFAKSEGQVLDRGKIIDNIEIRFNDELLEVNCKVTSILILKPYMIDRVPYAGSRVSFQFVDLTPVQKEKIEIFLKSYEEEINFISNY